MKKFSIDGFYQSWRNLKKDEVKECLPSTRSPSNLDQIKFAINFLGNFG